MTILEMEIHGSPALATGLFGGGESVAPGRTIDLGDDITLEFRGAVPERDFGESEILMLALSFPVGIAATAVGERLFRILQGSGHRTEVLTIGGYSIQIGQLVKIESTFVKIVEAARSDGESQGGGDSQE